ncbi:MAG: SusD/RagB family nutrient-binding outer membrane lipoprotein [Lunatimonas sp.]|uniref:SusD/RagB family nutrient-binding outer membrane lipoprotein n=1 Tax=Lunatimonas sp. TaxID=2060141 RepID=UPI00263A837D|nr:SusD/RagB family nutrient-binding outer membrane lipoprotein [Lunatimonas sp.]MCC5938496.1 SusD/RagB family nutrient-binding outer membrane lipoprotein [Lunatimonas sp.]
MNIKHIAWALLLIGFTVSCQISDFEDSYVNPATVAETSIEKQFTGFIIANRNYVLPSYDNYFISLRITANRFTHSIGWVNGENQYVPGSAAINNRWSNYYQFLAQYRELQKVYNGLSAQQQTDYRLYMITAATYLYDHTQKIVDLHGDIPWSKAGMLSTNGGNFGISYPEYDTAESIYTKMLDDLAGFADELRSLNINPGIKVGFDNQDLINRGDINQWLRYINSLRIRMLTTVSGTSTFGARANTEIAAILANPGNYPIVSSNANNINFRIHTLGTLIGATSFQSGLEDWNGNIASKYILEHMINNGDPRLTYLFEPGIEAEGEFISMDPLANQSVQTELVATNTLAIYNRSTTSRNQYFPGVLINSAQVHLMLAEYFTKQNQTGQAKQHYETAIRESFAYYQGLRSLSNNAISPAPAAVTADDLNAYIAAPEVSWETATNATERMRLIARQKWLHFNVIQPFENWAEMRRVDVLNLPFWEDQSNQQRFPPNRWIYPDSEQTYNPENYARVQPTDNLTTRIFWDVD